MDEEPYRGSSRMVRIGISVEGVTEERFIKMVLYPYLFDKQIVVIPISMGGDVNLDRIRSELQNIANDFDYVSTLYDFYGFGDKSANETKDTLEQKMNEHVHDSIRNRLIPYIQMYEFEGLLFSSPASIAAELKDGSLAQWAESILQRFNDNPEKINDSTETAPSKRLEKDTNYKKTIHGPNIAKEIGIDAIREKCAGFHDWLSRLEACAR